MTANLSSTSNSMLVRHFDVLIENVFVTKTKVLSVEFSDRLAMPRKFYIHKKN